MVLVIASTLFSIAFLLHIVIWKIRVPKKQKMTLLILYTFVTVIGLVGTKLWIYLYPQFFPFASVTTAEYFHIGLYVMTLAYSYIVVYTAVESDSPSLKTMVKLNEVGGNGMNETELLRLFNGEKFLRSRLHHLVEDKMLFGEADYYCLTPKGQWFLAFCLLYRKILGIKGDVG